MSFETWVDSQISRAQAQGAFEGLPGTGARCPGGTGRRPRTTGPSSGRGGRTATTGTGRRHAPAGLALRRERDLLPAAVTQLPTEAAVRAMAEDYNERVRAFWRRPQFTPDVVPGLADVEALTAHWRDTRPAPQPAPDPDPAPVRPARRWFRAAGPQRSECAAHAEHRACSEASRGRRTR